MIANMLMMTTSEQQFSEEQLELYSNFYRQNKIRFCHKKCNERPFFELHIIDGETQKYNNSRPVIKQNFYDDKTMLKSSEKKILIPLEMLEDKLDSFRKFSIDGIIESCHPMSIKALVKRIQVCFLFFSLLFIFQSAFYFSRGRSCFGALLKTDKKRLEERRKADLYI